MKTRLSAVLLAFALCGSAWSQPQTAALPAVLVKQDANFYRVDDKLYRSEQLTEEDAGALEQQGIRSIVNLRFFDRNDNQPLFGRYGIALINKPLLTWRIRPKQIAETLYLIEQQQKNGPVLVHCYHGADRTGLIIGMYRIIYQGWTVEAAKKEMQQGPYGYHSIWKNIEKLFSEENVREVKLQLDALYFQEARR